MSGVVWRMASIPDSLINSRHAYTYSYYYISDIIQSISGGS